MEGNSITVVISIIGIVLGGFQTVNILMLSNIKTDLKKDSDDLWKRVNSHRHEAKCEGKDCRKVTVGEVIITHGEA